MSDILKFFTNEELLDRFSEFYRKSKNPNSSKRNEELGILLRKEILKRMIRKED